VAADLEDGETTNVNYPWPYLSKFMSLKETTSKGYTFVCNLCKPKFKTLSTSKTSSTNLRTHIQVSNGHFKCINYPALLLSMLHQISISDLITMTRHDLSASLVMNIKDH